MIELFLEVSKLWGKVGNIQFVLIKKLRAKVSERVRLKIASLNSATDCCHLEISCITYSPQIELICFYAFKNIFIVLINIKNGINMS